MNFLDFLKRKDKITEIINDLKKEHQYLLELYNNINENIKNNNFDKVKEDRELFLQELLKHLEKEDNNIYKNIYDLEKIDKTVLETIQKIQKDIEPIANKLLISFKKFKKIDNSNKFNFLYDFNYLGSIILKRINFEEKILYNYFLQKFKNN